MTIHFLAMDFSLFWGTIITYLMGEEGKSLDRNHTMMNIGIGMAAGAVLGMALSPRKNALKSNAQKAYKAVEGVAQDVAHSVSQNLGM